jgi:alkenylglycerophosphocholine/alkenylglycerophosphoethanolamine hydrolase
LPFVVWIGGVYLLILPNLGAMAVPVGVYSLVICVMIWRAAALVTRPAEQWQLASVVGATLFGLSDSALAVMRFQGAFPYGAAFLILAYWAGQTGIAMSAQKGFAKSMPPI